jgi:hemoglobin
VSEGEDTPFSRFGGEPSVTRLVARFYALMAEREPALARLHRCDDAGRVEAEGQERFRLFLVGWLGGPQTYMERHGHPRLRMRHAQVPVTVEMRDAWMRCLSTALREGNYPPEAASFVEARLADVAAFLQNAS